MKLLRIVMFMILVTSCHFVSLAQSNIYSTITKNINTKAASLAHNLNATGDTLLLKSEFPLSKIEIISDSGVQVMPLGGDKKEVKVPLSFLEVGNYTLSVLFIEGKDDTYIYSKTVVFKIARLLPIMEFTAPNTRLATTTDLNKEIFLKPSEINDSESSQFANSEKQSKQSRDTKGVLINNEALKQFYPPGETALKDKKFTNKNKAVATSKNTKISKSESEGSIFVPYSLSDPRRLSNDKRYVIQSRAEYRAANLRPNGKPYD